jgi:rubrerythrin
MDRKSLLEAFRIAIDKEDESAKFYTDLAAQADDPEMRTLLNRFAFEEHTHGDKLKELYRNLRETVEESTSD